MGDSAKWPVRVRSRRWRQTELRPRYRRTVANRFDFPVGPLAIAGHVSSAHVHGRRRRSFAFTQGARPLRRAIQRLVEDPLFERILWKEFRAGEVVVDVEGDKITLRSAELQSGVSSGS